MAKLEQAIDRCQLPLSIDQCRDRRNVEVVKGREVDDAMLPGLEAFVDELAKRKANEERVGPPVADDDRRPRPSLA